MKALDWDTFRGGLGTTLIHDLPPGGVVIISDRESSARTVQFAKETDGITALVTPGWDGFDPNDPSEDDLAGLARLKELGWSQEAYDLDENLECRLTGELQSTDFRRLAEMSVAALRDVLGVADPATLSYRSFVSPRGDFVLLPGLRIPERYED